MKSKYFITFLFSLAFISLFSQRKYNRFNNHYDRYMTIEPSFNIGKNNIGGGLMAGYYVMDNFLVRGGMIYRDFKYKSYSETIYEFNIEGAYTFYNPRYSSRFRNFNFSAIAGIAGEVVKVTSDTKLIKDYPKLIYGTIGGEVEYTISDRLGILGHFKQYYAFNGSSDELGYTRFDTGIKLRYYIRN